MKKLFTGIILTITTCVAFAIPSPQQIENALAGGNPAYARSAIQEVLTAKPASGKAHLLNAYLLSHYDLNNSAANTELIKAITLEPKLTDTPLFGRVVDELDTHKQIHVAPTPVVATTYIRSNEDQKAAEYVLIGCLILGGVMLIVLTFLCIANRNERNVRDEHDPYADPTIVARGKDRRYPYSSRG